MCGANLSAAVTAIGIALAEGKSVEEINLLGAVFTQIGDSLFTISAQQELCCKNSGNTSTSQ